MGDIADMIINGDMCQECGEFVGPGDGFPITCNTCRADGYTPSGQGEFKLKPANHKKVACSICQKLVKEVGMRQHMESKHPGDE